MCASANASPVKAEKSALHRLPLQFRAEMPLAYDADCGAPPDLINQFNLSSLLWCQSFPSSFLQGMIVISVRGSSLLGVTLSQILPQCCHSLALSLFISPPHRFPPNSRHLSLPPFSLRAACTAVYSLSHERYVLSIFLGRLQSGAARACRTGKVQLCNGKFVGASWNCPCSGVDKRFLSFGPGSVVASAKRNVVIGLIAAGDVFLSR